MISGTIISVVLTKEMIYLLSDGRLVNNEKKEIISESHSKIHWLSKYAGLLVAGKYMPKVPNQVREIIKFRKLLFIDEIVEHVENIFIPKWEELIKTFPPDTIKEARAFAFITGFDKKYNPRLFYIDSCSSPIFKIQEGMLFRDNEILECSIMANHPPANIDVSQTFIDILTLKSKGGMQTFSAILESFNYVKEQLSMEVLGIGGKTFASVIDKSNGFLDINFQ